MLKGYTGSTEPLSKNTVGTANVAGTRFQNISNPYSEMPRVQTGWDRLLNWLGFRSGYDKAQEQYNLAGAEYNSQLEQLASEEAYNSPSAQAARMRAAGLNPDLTGVSGEPASEFDNQQTPPNINAGTDVNPLDVVSHIGSGVMSALTGTMAILKDFNLLKQTKIAVDSQDLDYANKMTDFLLKVDPMTNKYQYSADGSVGSTDLNSLFRPFFHSRKGFNKFINSWSSYNDSLMQMTNQYKNVDDYYKSRFNVANHISQPYFSPIGVGSENMVAGLLYDLNQIAFDALKGQKNAELWRAKKEASKDTLEANAYDKLNAPDSSATDDLATSIQEGFKAETAESKTRQAISPLKIDSIKIQKRILDGLQKFADKDGSIGAQILSMILSSKIAGVSIFGPIGDVANDVVSVAKKVIP